MRYNDGCQFEGKMGISKDVEEQSVQSVLLAADSLNVTTDSTRVENTRFYTMFILCWKTELFKKRVEQNLSNVAVGLPE